MPSEHFPSVVFARRMVLLIALHERPHTRAELYQLLSDAGYGADDHVAGEIVAAPPATWVYKLNADRRDMKVLGYIIGFDPKRSHYYWTHSPFGLSLTGDQLVALALLRRTFSSQTFPRVAEIRALLDTLAARLPPTQRQALDRVPPGLVIQLAEAGDYEGLDPHTLAAIEAALKNKRQLEFDYASPKHTAIIRHCVTIESFVFKDGHVYLYGWKLGYAGRLQFRVERIVPHSTRSAGTADRTLHHPIRIQYRLTADLVRGGVSPRFAATTVTIEDNGSALITAETNDLWEAHKILLGYGAQACAVSPPALVDLMREAVAGMAGLYHVDSEG